MRHANVREQRWHNVHVTRQGIARLVRTDAWSHHQQRNAHGRFDHQRAFIGDASIGGNGIPVIASEDDHGTLRVKLFDPLVHRCFDQQRLG